MGSVPHRGWQEFQIKTICSGENFSGSFGEVMEPRAFAASSGLNPWSMAVIVLRRLRDNLH
jgi:hypothetical protein